MELTGAQPIVDVTISTDYEDFKASIQDFGVKRSWKTLIGSLVYFVLSVLLAWVIASATRQIHIGEFAGNIVNAYSTSHFWALNYLFSLLPATLLIMNIRECFVNARSTKLFESYKRVFYIESPRRYVFTEGCLICTYYADPYHHSRIEVAYPHYSETWEGKSLFYLVHPKVGSILLPKKCFTEEQIIALRDLLARKYGEKFKEV